MLTMHKEDDAVTRRLDDLGNTAGRYRKTIKRKEMTMKTHKNMKWNGPSCPGSALRLAMLVLVAAIFGLTASQAFAGGRHARKPAFCTTTANDVRRACRHEAHDDYWIAMGNCRNLSDAGARAVCKKEALVALKEGKEECREQREARLDVCKDIGQAPYDPPIDPALFVDPAQIGTSVTANPYFPLVRGRTRIYQGGTEHVEVTVTSDTKVIQGVTCAVVRDVVMDNGEVIEDTKDWFAQDVDGNVWYFGEVVQDFEGGELVSMDGSWTAGVDGAKAGRIMKAAPAVGDVYRQEFALGDAEDLAEVLSLTASETVPAASCNGNCLMTKDFTPIEPDSFEHKYYAPGVGLILEVHPATGERLELIEVRN